MKQDFTYAELDKIYTNRYLSDIERNLFFYYYIKGFSLEDVAAELELSYATTVKHKNKLLKKALDIIS